jgi:hypothetical protein
MVFLLICAQVIFYLTICIFENDDKTLPYEQVLQLIERQKDEELVSFFYLGHVKTK